MKRNLFPFLGIAFVVALAATGVFYGLFVGKISGASSAAANNAGVVVVSRSMPRGAVLTGSDLRLRAAGAERLEGSIGSAGEVIGRTLAKPLAADEVVTLAALAGAKGSGQLAIPKGMRAISIRVAESTGLVPYLRAGDRIDVQSIQAQGNGETMVRTLLVNAEVLNVHVDPSPQPAPVTVVNLLVPAGEVERVALADSAAKVRIVLRNSDEAEAPAAGKMAPAAPLARTVTAIAPMPRVHFEVRMLAAGTEAVRDLSARAGLTDGGNGGVRIGLLPAGWSAEAIERSKGLRLLGTENLDSPQWQEVSLRAGGARQTEYDLRLRLMPWVVGKGNLRVRVRPELTVPERGGFSSRKSSADLTVAEGQSVLVAGFERDSASPALVDKLFHSPSAAETGSELLLVVTPRVAAR